MIAWLYPCRCAQNITTTGVCTCYDRTAPTWVNTNYVLNTYSSPPTPPPKKKKYFAPPKNHQQQREWWNRY